MSPLGPPRGSPLGSAPHVLEDPNGEGGFSRHWFHVAGWFGRRAAAECASDPRASSFYTCSGRGCRMAVDGRWTDIPFRVSILYLTHLCCIFEFLLRHCHKHEPNRTLHSELNVLRWANSSSQLQLLNCPSLGCQQTQWASRFVVRTWPGLPPYL